MRQGFAPLEIVERREAHLRYEGVDLTLAVTWAGRDAMKRAFLEQHRARYGFLMPERRLVIETVGVEAIGLGADPAGSPAAAVEVAIEQGDRGGMGDAAAGDVERALVYLSGAWRETPILRRGQFGPSAGLEGPAIVLEPTSTIVVECGWTAELLGGGELLLRRSSPPPRPSADPRQRSPLLLEVFNNLFMSIAEQMGATLANTAASVNIKERLDFSCALFDEAAGLVANAPHLPVHLGSMSAAVRAVLDRHRGALRPGDAHLAELALCRRHAPARPDRRDASVPRR